MAVVFIVLELHCGQRDAQTDIQTMPRLYALPSGSVTNDYKPSCKKGMSKTIYCKNATIKILIIMFLQKKLQRIKEKITENQRKHKSPRLHATIKVIYL